MDLAIKISAHTGEQEHKNTLANHYYYPDTDRHRRILDIPFSMIMLDGIEVGLELVNSNNPRVLFRSLDKGSRVCNCNEKLLPNIWDKASENI